MGTSHMRLEIANVLVFGWSFMGVEVEEQREASCSFAERIGIQKSDRHVMF